MNYYRPLFIIYIFLIKVTLKALTISSGRWLSSKNSTIELMVDDLTLLLFYVVFVSSSSFSCCFCCYHYQLINIWREGCVRNKDTNLLYMSIKLVWNISGVWNGEISVWYNNVCFINVSIIHYWAMTVNLFIVTMC